MSVANFMHSNLLQSLFVHKRCLRITYDLEITTHMNVAFSLQ